MPKIMRCRSQSSTRLHLRENIGKVLPLLLLSIFLNIFILWCILLYIHLHQHLSLSGISARPWVHPPAQHCWPKVAPELRTVNAPSSPGWLQENAEAVSALAFSLPASLTASCSGAYLPSMPQSQITTTECLQLEFPLQLLEVFITLS